ncbi:MAG: hypothetical protein ACKOX6_18300 [Bdellovibrio sp.]
MNLDPKAYRRAAEVVFAERTHSCCAALGGDSKLSFEEYLNHTQCFAEYFKVHGRIFWWWIGPDGTQEEVRDARTIALLLMEQIVKDEL